MASHSQYISPHQLVEQSHAEDSYLSQTSRKQRDFGALAPGRPHRLAQIVPPTPSAILDGSYHRYLNSSEEQDLVIYFPRKPEYTGAPSIPSINFSVNGKPGPYISDICKGKVSIDGGYDQVFAYHGWRQSSYMIDWPGIKLGMNYLPVVDDKGRPVNRAQFAAVLAVAIKGLILNTQKGAALPLGPQIMDANSEGWSIYKVNYRDVRLIGVNYYKKVWIPVLAVDAEY
ncbi:hypothetical protein BDQ12DRAFT_655655 [Crucibulum laeve]|uniref:Uncharacterized protein n=1 Tax=Crucibulum laeve TaxID=68775 RepID=A0A5C3LRX0_9AGAR|nr:hypothetical protein BDQ12DRAFT_655655 [Crucibulum laeve]